MLTLNERSHEALLLLLLRVEFGPRYFVLIVSGTKHSVIHAFSPHLPNKLEFFTIVLLVHLIKKVGFFGHSNEEE